MSKCPICGFEAASPAHEIAHMESKHPEVISERFAAAGISPDEVADYRQGPDLPSYLTMRELHLLTSFAYRFVLQYGLDEDDTMIGIHVRDRGMASQMPASWVEFEVGIKRYAFWRATMDLYEVGPDGAVGEDPIHRGTP